MASYKKKNDFEYNNGNNKIPDSFNFSSDGTNNPYSEDFVFHFEDNKISATNDVGFTGLEENDESASNAKAKKLELDENNNNNNSDSGSETEAASESSAASSSSSASSSASASSSSTATATASTTAGASVASAVGTVAAVATSAVVLVVGGSLAIYGQTLEKPQIVEFEDLSATTNSIYFSLLVGNDKESIENQEEIGEETAISVELSCETYQDYKEKRDFKTFGRLQGQFEDLEPDTEYTINVLQTTLMDLDSQYLIEPIKISTIKIPEPTPPEPVVIMPESFRVSPNEATVYLNETLELSVVDVLPEGADASVKWTSSAPSVVSVDENGVVTGLEVTQTPVTITATSTLDGSVSDAAKITVATNIVEPDSFNIYPEAETIDVGETLTLSIIDISPENADTSVTWESSNPNVASVDSSGVVTGESASQERVVITATSIYNEEVFAKAIISVEEPTIIPTSFSLSPGGAQMTVGDELVLTITDVIPSNADTTMNWESSNPEAVSVSEGILFANEITEQTVTIIASSIYDEEVYAYAYIDVIPKVIAPESFSIDPEEVSIEEEETILLSVIDVLPENADDSVIWSSSDDDIASVDVSGLVTGHTASEEAVIITATSTVDQSVSASAWVYVDPKIIKPQSFSITPSELHLHEEDTEELSLTDIYPQDADATVEWSSSDPEVANVDSNGVVTAIAVSEDPVTITATSIYDNEVYATATVYVEVPDPSYTPMFDKMVDPYGNVELWGRFDVEYETRTFRYFSLTLTPVDGEYAGIQDYTAQLQIGAQEIEARMKYEISVPIDYSASYLVELTGVVGRSRADGDPTGESEPVTLYSDELNFASLTETYYGEDTHSNTMYLHRTLFTDMDENIISDYYKFSVFVDTEDDYSESGYAWQIGFIDPDMDDYTNFYYVSGTVAIDTLRATVDLPINSDTEVDPTGTYVLTLFRSDPNNGQEAPTAVYFQTVNLAMVDTETQPFVDGASFGIARSYYDARQVYVDIGSLGYNQGEGNFSIFLAEGNAENINADSETSLMCGNVEVWGNRWYYRDEYCYLYEEIVNSQYDGQLYIIVGSYIGENEEIIYLYDIPITKPEEEEIEYIDGCANISYEEYEGRDVTQGQQYQVFVSLNLSNDLLNKFVSFKIKGQDNSGEVEFGAEGIASTQRVPLYLYTDGEITSNYWISDSDFQYWNYEVYGITSTGEEIYIFSEQNWH